MWTSRVSGDWDLTSCLKGAPRSNFSICEEMVRWFQKRRPILTPAQVFRDGVRRLVLMAKKDARKWALQ